MTFTSTDCGAKAEYSCNKGYKLVGPNERTCDRNGQWTGATPNCTRRFIKQFFGFILCIENYFHILSGLLVYCIGINNFVSVNVMVCTSSNLFCSLSLSI